MYYTHIAMVRTLIVTGIGVIGVLLYSPPGLADESSRSSLVYPGRDGRLVYHPDERGDMIPDFSHAGYMGGGIALPHMPVRETLYPGSGADAERIQNAIDRVSALPQDAYGFRGAVLLKKGQYNLEKPLRIAASGVVLRGEGAGDDRTELVGLGAIRDRELFDRHSNVNLVIIAGEHDKMEVSGSAANIIDEYVPVGARTFRTGQTGAFRTGDTVIVRRHGNMDWVREMGMDLENKDWAWKPMKHDFDRIVTRIDGDRITIDAPITNAIDARWGGGEIIKYTDEGRIRQVGIENLRGISAFDRTVVRSDYGNIDRYPYIGETYYADEDHYWNFISIDNACNVWVRDVTALHFANSTVFMAKGAKWVTVQDCTTSEPVSFAAGVRRFTYQIRGQLCLVQRCFSDKGRHSFVLCDPTACGPNVFLDCVATRPYSSSEPHSQYVVGALFDNVKAPLTSHFWKDIALMGWAGGNCVFWNCEGMYLVQKPPTAQNYAIGHVGIHACVFNTICIDYSLEDGFIESWDTPVEPRSLYLKQLEDRLGKSALTAIGAE